VGVEIRKRAAIRALLATAAWALLMLVPLVQVISLIGFMLPLWALADLGVPGLGRELNGFFLPSAIGWGLIAGVVWLMFFLFFRRRLMRAAAAAGSSR
jgi:uncharacterized membrane protein